MSTDFDLERRERERERERERVCVCVRVEGGEISIQVISSSRYVGVVFANSLSTWQENVCLKDLVFRVTNKACLCVLQALDIPPNHLLGKVQKALLDSRRALISFLHHHHPEKLGKERERERERERES
jgi:hypothetical protein